MADQIFNCLTADLAAVIAFFLLVVQTYRCSFMSKRIRQLECQRDILSKFVQLPIERLKPLTEDLRRDELNRDFSKNRFDPD